MRNTLVRLAAAALIAAPLALFAPSALADTVNVDFESPTYSVGNINGQDGWSKTGGYDVAVTSSPVISGSQSLRMSDAVTSGSFGDQTFSKSLTNEAGETTDALNNGFSGGVRQPHFEAQFTFASTMPNAQQPGMHMSVSPDRGDGARMSYLRFEDQTDGIHVFFDDVQGTSTGFQVANFVETDIATLNRSVPHTIKFSMDFVDGPSNDVVKIYIDGSLIHTGTSWENYFRFDTESQPDPSYANKTRTVDSLLFRESGTATPADAGKGFLVDNLSLMSGPGPKVVIAKYVDGVHATAQNANSAVFPMITSWVSSGVNGTQNNVPFTLSSQPWGGIGDPYEATYINGQVGDNYSTNEVTTGNQVVAATCSGTPFALVGYTTGNSWSEAQQATPSLTIPAFTNLQNDKYVIVWNKTCPMPPPANACATPDHAPQGWTLRTGTAKSDTVILTPFTMFVGNGGNDTVVAGDGDYIVCTGAGNDTIKVGTGNSVIDAGNGNNTVKTGDGDQRVTTGSGNDIIVTGAGNDIIDAGNGNNTVSAGAGNDTITTGSGNDIIDGGPGTDTCNAGAGHNTKSNCEL